MISTKFLDSGSGPPRRHPGTRLPHRPPRPAWRNIAVTSNSWGGGGSSQGLLDILPVLPSRRPLRRRRGQCRHEPTVPLSPVCLTAVLATTRLFPSPPSTSSGGKASFQLRRQDGRPRCSGVNIPHFAHRLLRIAQRHLNGLTACKGAAALYASANRRLPPIGSAMPCCCRARPRPGGHRRLRWTPQHRCLDEHSVQPLLSINDVSRPKEIVAAPGRSP